MQQLDLFNKDNDKIAVFRPKKKKTEVTNETETSAVEMQPELKEEVVMPVENSSDVVAEENIPAIEEQPVITKENVLPEVEEEVVIETEKINPAVEKTIEQIAEKKQPQLIKPLSKKIEEPAKRGRKSLKEINLDVALLEVPDDETLSKKQYYSISEVAEWFNMKASLLRFWENEFDVLKPKKNKKGDRLFRPEDVKTLRLIYYLLRQQKYSVEGAKQFLKDNRKKAEMQLQLVESLTKFRSFLLELRANLGA